jgi:hydantoinase/carbamoylase family amidase
MHLSLRADRLARDLAALAELGRDPSGGMTRPALSPADAQARSYVKEQMLALGRRVEHDQVGNLFGRRRGREDLACVMTGSHLDTVPRGGRFDGPLGIVGALEALRALDEAGVETRRPIDVAVFVGEEGSRFKRGTIGSATLAGEIPVEEIWALRDAEGVSFKDALETYGDDGAPRSAAQPRGSVHAFVELHIEQGGVLEAAQVPIGAVTAINGLLQHVIRLVGDANHAGATPMNLRRDALCCAAELVLAVEDAAREEGGVATVGNLVVEPGAFNIIPGAVTLSTDLRAPVAKILDALDARVRRVTGDLSARRRIQVEITARQRVAPGPCDELVISAVEGAASAASLASLRMPSGAIHDALHMAAFCPSGMIFVPSRGGKSHCPEEHTPIDELLPGCTVLAGTLATLAA